MKQTLSIPERHQLKIARDTLKMSDVGARIMGGLPKRSQERLYSGSLVGLQRRKVEPLLNDTERAAWIDNDEILHDWWKRSKQSKRTFVREHRPELDSYIKWALGFDG